MREADIDAATVQADRTGNGPDAIVELELDGVRRRFAVVVKSRAPYPSELRNLEPRRIQLSLIGNPLLIAPYVSDSLAAALIRTGWSWADQTGNFDIRAPQLRAKQRLSSSPAKLPKAQLSLPQGAGALAIIRFLINRSAPDQPFGPTELAQIGRVSQPRASQVLHQLRDAQLITGAGRDWFADREALLEAFLTKYRGPGGSELHFYSLDSPLEVARDLVRWANSQEWALSVSADVGPDLIEPWRRPTHVVAYLREALAIDTLNLVEAHSRADANVTLRIPDDFSVFPTHPLIHEVNDLEITLADVTQMIWELKDLGGSDREEAADHLRTWLLSH